jgi:hypothetical protein
MNNIDETDDEYNLRIVKRRVKSLISLTLLAWSCVLMPVSTINLYDSRKEYYSKNPQQVDYYVKDPEGNARTEAYFLGMLWGGANCGSTLLCTYFLMTDPPRRKSKII